MLTLKKSKNLIVILLNLKKSKIKLTTRLPWAKLDAWAFSFWKLGHPVFWFTSLFLTQSVRLFLVTYPSLCSAMWLTGHHAMPVVTKFFLPNPLPREAEDFPRGGNLSRHMPLLTHLAWLQPIHFDPKLIFKHVKTEIFLLVVKTLIKNIRQQSH